MNIFDSPNIERMASQHDYYGLQNLLQHNDRLIRLQAAQALAELNDEAGWRFLFDSLRQTKDLESRIISASMLGELGDPRAIPVLGEQLQRLRFVPVADEFSEALKEALETIGGHDAEDALRKAGYEPVLPQVHHTLIEYDAEYVRPVLSGIDEIRFLTAEQHLDSAVELREAEHPERGLVEDSLALWLSPQWAYAWYLRGVLLEDLERNYEALLSYRRAVTLDPTLKDARQALEELGSEQITPVEDVQQLMADLNSRDWSMRRDAAAGLEDLALSGNPKADEAVEMLISRLDDEEREVRYAAVRALGLMDDRKAVLPLLSMQESSWLLRFAIVQSLSKLGSVEGLTTVLHREMDRIQERNPVFSRNKDPLLEVEYDALMEIGVRALEGTGDLESLLFLAEGNAWEENEDEDEDEEGDESEEDRLESGWSIMKKDEDTSTFLDEEDLSDEEENLENYVDEVAEMVVVALQRLALPRLSSLNTALLERLAAVPDLTLIDVSSPEAEPAVVQDLTPLREAASAELARRKG